MPAERLQRDPDETGIPHSRSARPVLHSPTLLTIVQVKAPTSDHRQRTFRPQERPTRSGTEDSNCTTDLFKRKGKKGWRAGAGRMRNKETGSEAENWLEKREEMHRRSVGDLPWRPDVAPTRLKEEWGR